MDEFRDYHNLIYGRRKKQISATTILIIVNVAVFLIAIIFGLINLLAFRPTDFVAGKNVWTLITSIFMHGGIGHIIFNMITLLSLGGLLERMIGTKRFLINYFAAGLFGSLFMVILYLLSSDPRIILLNIFNLTAAENIAAVGASGALFGIAGMLIILKPKLPVMIFFIPIGIPLIYAIIGLFLLFSFIPWRIANSAHLGGLLVGLFLGWYWFKRNARVRRLSLVRGI